MREVRRAAIQAQKNCKETLPRARRLTKEMMLYWKKYDKVEKEHRKRAEKEALEQRKLDEEMREVGGGEAVWWSAVRHMSSLSVCPWQAKRQQRKLNFLITQTELYAHFMSGKASMAGPEGDAAQEDILRKLDDTTTQRQIDIGGGLVVNTGQEDYGLHQPTFSSSRIKGPNTPGSFGFFAADSERYKSQALRNAKEAYQIHQERVWTHTEKHTPNHWC